MLRSLVVVRDGEVAEETGDVLVEAAAWGAYASSPLVTIPAAGAVSVRMQWYSVNAGKAFSTELRLSLQEESDSVVMGIARSGMYAVWLCRQYGKRMLQSCQMAEEVKVNMDGVTPWNPFMTYAQWAGISLGRSHPQAHDYPNDACMRQFTYRYLPLFQHWDKGTGEWRGYGDGETMSVLDYMDEALFDGTHDKLRDGGLLRYHQAGKPKKLAVAWHEGKAEYAAYFWFDDEGIRAAFDRFYGLHPDTRGDLMVRIDAERDRYELALYRYGLGEPQVIREDAYQMIVFKNKFERYRSDNYNQPRGAWIW